MRLNAVPFLWLVASKSLIIPKDGWNSHSFGHYGAGMVRSMHRAAQITQRRQIPIVARAAVNIFNAQLDKVIALVERRRPVKADSGFITLAFESHQSLWLDALQQVFSETGGELVAELMPPIQSVMAQGLSKTSILLGADTVPNASAMITRKARGIADKITKINSTTRKEFEKVIVDSFQDGLTFGETVQELRDKIPKVNSSRQMTIARTELSNAWNQGSIEAFQQSETLVACSVIGCTSREEESWDKPSYQQFMFRGESTCNIQDVAVHDLDQLNFHPNHTGVIVPSQFRNADGSVTPLA